MKIILTFILLLPALLSAAILQVALDGSQPYTNIQIAIDSASEQDTILVHPGTYFENIEISGRHLTISSLELITSDSTYIAQTVIDGNQSSSCIFIDGNAIVTIRGLYMTNGIGTPTHPDYGDLTRVGGGVYAYDSDVSIINCRVINNRAKGGAGILLAYSSGYLAGTIISNNWGESSGAFRFFGYSVTERTLEFDPINRCSIYNNYASIGIDMFITLQHMTHIDIYLDKFTVPESSVYFRECVSVKHEYEYNGIEATFTFHCNTTVLTQQYADFYVSPDGDDANAGLSPEEPLKTIALALHRIGADSQRPHTIYLANGIYAEDQHFPLNLRSYVSIVGESEEGVIFGVGAPTTFINGWDSEKEVTIKNITFQGPVYQGFARFVLIFCKSRDTFVGVVDKFSLTLENISFRNIYPLHYNLPLVLAQMTYPEKLILRNVTVENCMVSTAFYLWGGNVYGDNVRIHNTYASPYGLLAGHALNIFTNDPLRTGGDNIFHNLEITNCNSRSIGGSLDCIVKIGHSFLPTEFRTYFINSTITDNHWSTGYGAAINLLEDAKVSFINSIISNEAGINFMLLNEDLPSNLQFLNCLVGPSENPEDTVYNMGPNNTIEWYGTNLSCDPGFYAWEEGNPYTLGQDSPCIDAGTMDFSIFNLPDWYQFPAYDLTGDPRIYGNQVDMGAYEWQGQVGVENLLAPPTLSMNNYPNPFNPSTTIEFNIPENGRALVSVYNTKGQRVKNLLDADLPRGKHTLVWDGRDANNRSLASGIYFFKLESGGKTSFRKVMLMK